MSTSEHRNQSESAVIDPTKLAAAQAAYVAMDHRTRAAFDNWVACGGNTAPVQS